MAIVSSPKIGETAALTQLTAVRWNFTDFVFDFFSSKQKKRFDQQNVGFSPAQRQNLPTKMGYLTKDRYGHPWVIKGGNGKWLMFPSYEPPFISIQFHSCGIFQPATFE